MWLRRALCALFLFAAGSAHAAHRPTVPLSDGSQSFLAMRCDGTTDVSAQLAEAVSYAASRKMVVSLPSGICRFTSPQVWDQAAVGHWGLRGSGSYQTTLLYDGASVTADLIQIGNCGDPTNHPVYGLTLSNLKIDSNVTMSGGSAMHACGVAQSHVDHVIWGGQNGTHKLFHGPWFDVFDAVHVDFFEAAGASTADSFRLNGNSAGSFGADLYLTHGKISLGRNGLHIGGGQGGTTCSDVAIIANGTNVLIDHALSGSANREVFLGDTCVIDTAGWPPGPTGGGDNILINDPLASNGHMTINGWASSGHANNIHVVSWPSGSIAIGSAVNTNSTGDGIRVEDATTTTINISSGAQINKNGGLGVNCTVPTNNIFSGTEPAANTGGQWAANCHQESGLAPLSNGYRKHPDGIVEQWVQVGFTGAANTILSPAGGNPVALPVAFPNNMFDYSITCTPAGFGNGIQNLSVTANPNAATGLSIFLISSGAVSSPQLVNCRVLGN